MTSQEAGTTGAPLDRSEAFAMGAPGVPRKFVLWLLVAVVVLGGGGAVLEHVLGAHGIPSAAAQSTTATTVVSASSGGTTPAVHLEKQPTLAALLGAAPLGGAMAPSFDLVDQRGAQIALTALRGRPVVVAFMDARCNDICPILMAELRRAETDLGARASGVEFVVINTDPLATAPNEVAQLAARYGLQSASNWYFLTGSLQALDTVWTHYGVTVEVAKATGTVAHTEVLYFLDSLGRERFRATPYANESRTGAESLPVATVDRFAAGVATYARRLT